MSSVEYSGLLRVSRPLQTEDSGVPDMKKMEHTFVNLFKYVEKCHEDFRKAYEDEKREALDVVYQKMKARLAHYQKMHEQSINRIRRSYRSRMTDIASQISVEARV
jgi:hypothetical protein